MEIVLSRHASEISHASDVVCAVRHAVGDDESFWHRNFGGQFCGQPEHDIHQFGAIHVLLWPVEFLFVYDGVRLFAKRATNAW